MLRDYLELDLRPTEALPFAFDLERIIDDVVLFCMLVGNDFLPPIPTLDINEGALKGDGQGWDCTWFSLSFYFYASSLRN